MSAIANKTKNLKRRNPKVSCNGCKHFEISHDYKRPWSCTKFAFKSKGIPAALVYLETGVECRFFEKR